MLTFHFVYQSSRCWNISLRFTFWVHSELIKCNVRLYIFFGVETTTEKNSVKNAIISTHSTELITKLGTFHNFHTIAEKKNLFIVFEMNGEKMWKNRQKKNRNIKTKKSEQVFVDVFVDYCLSMTESTDSMIWSDKKEACNKYTCILLWITSNELNKKMFNGESSHAYRNTLIYSTFYSSCQD